MGDQLSMTRMWHWPGQIVWFSEHYGTFENIFYIFHFSFSYFYIFKVKVSRRRKGLAFITNIATVLHDHQRSVTAGSIWTDSLVSQLHWPVEPSIREQTRPVSLSRHGGGGTSKRRGRCRANYAMWCCRATLPLDGWKQDNAHSWRMRPVIGQIVHPRFIVCASTVFLFCLAGYVSSVNLFL